MGGLGHPYGYKGGTHPEPSITLKPLRRVPELLSRRSKSENLSGGVDIPHNRLTTIMHVDMLDSHFLLPAPA